MSSDAAAKELIGFAKNRLNKFYNPKLYKPPAEPEAAMAQVASHGKVAPPPPPESFDAYSKKSEESNGIIAMMDALIKDLDKEMTEAEVTEKDAQADYEKMMEDLPEKRAEDSKTLTDKEGALADLQTGLGDQQAELASTQNELAATNQYFDMRKDARDNEIDALGKAKAVLSGADYSLVQMKTVTKSRSLLRRGAMTRCGPQ